MEIPLTCFLGKTDKQTDTYTDISLKGYNMMTLYLEMYYIPLFVLTEASPVTVGATCWMGSQKEPG